MKRCCPVFLSVLCLLSTVATAHAAITFAPGDYDNKPNTVSNSSVPTNIQTTGFFRDEIWWAINNGDPRASSPDYINAGKNLIDVNNHATPGGQYNALNFTGPAINGGQYYLSVYDDLSKPGKSLFDASQGMTVSADVLFTPGGHDSAGGVMTLYDEDQDGLALLANNVGGNNADNATLDLVFLNSSGSQLLTTVDLDNTLVGSPHGTTFVGDTWYHVSLSVLVQGDVVSVLGTIQNHVTGSDPTSALGTTITTLTFTESLSNPDASARALTNPGEVGIVAWGNNIGGSGNPPPFDNPTDNVGISVTNFGVDGGGNTNPALGTTVPEPGSLIVWSLLGLAAFASRRRRAA